MEFTVRSYCETQYNSVVREPTSAPHLRNYTHNQATHTLYLGPEPITVHILCAFINISCGCIFNFVPIVHNEKWANMCTQCFPHTYSFLYSGQLDSSSKNWPFLFLVVLAKTWCGVVASQSVADCGFPRMCSSLSLPILISLSFLFFSKLLLCFSFFFLLLSCKSSLSLLLFLSLPSLFPPNVGLIEVQYWMPADCCPPLSPISDGLLQHTSQHVSCWAWEAQAFALYNCICWMLQGFNHAESECILPAHSGRVGPSA